MVIPPEQQVAHLKNEGKLAVLPDLKTLHLSAENRGQNGSPGGGDGAITGNADDHGTI